MQTFAIIPAAGRSQRMGQPKLRMPWGACTVMGCVLAAWKASQVDHVIVVVHPLDDDLAKVCQAAGAEVVRPANPPPDMKTSIRLGLERAESYQPAASDAWLVAPADMPTLTSDTIDRLISAYAAGGEQASANVWVASRGVRRGHPVLFPWRLAVEVGRLPQDKGLNDLVDRSPVVAVPVADGAIFEDLDTPEDYQRLRPKEG
jgi:molybdenum cofactor cytidylyltransferase